MMKSNKNSQQMIWNFNLFAAVKDKFGSAIRFGSLVFALYYLINVSLSSLDGLNCYLPSNCPINSNMFIF